MSPVLCARGCRRHPCGARLDDPCFANVVFDVVVAEPSISAECPGRAPRVADQHGVCIVPDGKHRMPAAGSTSRRGCVDPARRRRHEQRVEHGQAKHHRVARVERRANRCEIDGRPSQTGCLPVRGGRARRVIPDPRSSAWVVGPDGLERLPRRAERAGGRIEAGARPPVAVDDLAPPEQCLLGQVLRHRGPRGPRDFMCRGDGEGDTRAALALVAHWGQQRSKVRAPWRDGRIRHAARPPASTACFTSSLAPSSVSPVSGAIALTVASKIAGASPPRCHGRRFSSRSRLAQAGPHGRRHAASQPRR